MPGPRKAKHDIAPAMRASFLSAIKEISRREGKPFYQVMADWMEKDPIALINAVSKFAVREAKVSGKVDHDHTHNHEHRTVSETADWLVQALGEGEDSPPKESVSH